MNNTKREEVARARWKLYMEQAVPVVVYASPLPRFAGRYVVAPKAHARFHLGDFAGQQSATDFCACNNLPYEVQEQSPDLTVSEDIKIAMADEEFERYGFGSDVTVVAHDNWNRDDPLDFTKVVYVRFPDMPPEADSEKLSFHVRFLVDGDIEEVYALEMRHGNEIGERGNVFA